MNTLDKWKTKIKSVNINKFNPMNKPGEGPLNSDPDTGQSTEPNGVSVAPSKMQQPYMAGMSEQLKPVAQQVQQQHPQQQPVQQQKTTVTFSINNMAEFSHEELQQVIKKYDGEYKKMKKQLQDFGQQQTELEERATKAEKESYQLKDQALCYQENVERLKEHVQNLMTESETEKVNHESTVKEKVMLHQEFTKLKEHFEELKVTSDEKYEKDTADLQRKLDEYESKQRLQDQIMSADGDDDKLKVISNQQIQELELKLQQLQDKYLKVELDNKSLQATIQKQNLEIEQGKTDLLTSITEKQKNQQHMEDLAQHHKEDLAKKQEIITKKDKMIEQFQKKLNEIMDQKQEYLDKIDELENKLKSSKDMVNALNTENDKYSNQFIDKVKSKDMLIENLNEELKHVKSTVRSQETTISYFRKKVDEIQKQLDEEKSERLNLQSEMKRQDHVSSKHDSPRDNLNHVSEEDFKAVTQQLINNQEVKSFTDNSPKFEAVNEIKDLKQHSLFKKDDLMIELSDRGLPKQSSHRPANKIKSFSGVTLKQSPSNQVQNAAVLDDLRKLREDYDQLAKEFEESKKAKSLLEDQLQEEKQRLTKKDKKLEELEDKIDQQDKTIQELERRRELAKKEIKVLNYKLEKLKLQSNSTNTNTSINQEEQKSRDQMTPIKSGKQVHTEENKQFATGVNGYTGIDKLKKIKRELEIFYKELIKVLFVDQIEKPKAIEMEKKVNMIIMSINDQIDEIEIRQVKEGQAMLNEIKVQQPQLELQKRSVRANSTDVRQQPNNPMRIQQQQQQQQQQKPQPQLMQMMSNIGSVIGHYNPYNANSNKTVVNNQMRANVGLPPQSPQHGKSNSAMPVKALHKNQ